MASNLQKKRDNQGNIKDQMDVDETEPVSSFKDSFITAQQAHQIELSRKPNAQKVPLKKSLSHTKPKFVSPLMTSNEGYSCHLLQSNESIKKYKSKEKRFK